MESQRVERVKRAQVNVVGQLSTAKGPEFLENERRGDNCRPGVEDKPVVLEHVGAAARLIELFQKRDAIAARAQTRRGSQAAEPGADNHGMGSCIPCLGRAFSKCQHLLTLNTVNQTMTM